MKFKSMLLPVLVLSSLMLSLVFSVSTVSAGNDNYPKYEKEKGYMKNIPVLPNCPQPGGQLIAGYETGLHQIPGGPLLSGSDYVWKVGDKLFVQCFCPEKGGTGVQSKWIHESYLNPKQESYLLSQGWIKITNGSDWGLPAGTYFVQNKNFSCNAGECKPTFNYQDRGDVKTEFDNRVHIQQTSKTNIHNNVHVKINTGDNKIVGNKGNAVIKTGDVSSVVNIDNSNAGSNQAYVNLSNDAVLYLN